MQQPSATTSAGTSTQPTERKAVPRGTPGKVAMWLFLATEIMFFTGLIGSYIVLRAGSSATTYSNLFPPGNRQAAERDAHGLRIVAPGSAEAAARVVHPLFQLYTGYSAKELAVQLQNGPLQTPGTDIDNAMRLSRELQGLGATVTVEPLRLASWPRPYDDSTNPLSIDLTAFNTFILICSSVTMVLALSAIQRGLRWRCALYLLGTLLIGGTFLGIQFYEYRELLFGQHYPIGVSSNGHFRPDASLFASCFFTMTGFHGAHVAGGLVAIFFIWLRTVFGGYSRGHHGPIELVGLYWHFVDLVWIILFTVVYLI